MYKFTSNAPLVAPLDHPTHIAGTRTFHRRQHHHTFSIGHFSGGDGTFNFNDSPSTLHPSRRSPSNQLQHPLPEQPLLKPAAGPA